MGLERLLGMPNRKAYLLTSPLSQPHRLIIYSKFYDRFRKLLGLSWLKAVYLCSVHEHLHEVWQQHGFVDSVGPVWLRSIGILAWVFAQKQPLFIIGTTSTADPLLCGYKTPSEVDISLGHKKTTTHCLYKSTHWTSLWCRQETHISNWIVSHDKSRVKMPTRSWWKTTWRGQNC